MSSTTKSLIGAEALRAPAAVHLLDADEALSTLELPVRSDCSTYRSAFLVLRRAGQIAGATYVAADDAGRVSEAQVSAAIARLPERGPGEHPHRPGPLPVDTSVVITTCGDRPDGVERCVTAVLRQSLPPLEVVVVNNRPRRFNVEEFLSARFGSDRTVRGVNESKPGLANARNAGLGAAVGEFVAFIDDDVVPEPDWLEAGRGRFADIDVDCVTGLILPSEFETASQVLFERFTGFGKGFESRTYSLAEPPEDQPLFPYTTGLLGSGANTFFGMEFLRALGGFDPALGAGTPTHGAEDLDIYLRVLTSGATLVYEPRAVVWHRHPDSPAEVRKRVFYYGVGLGAMFGKQLGVPARWRQLSSLAPQGLIYLLHPRSGKNRRKGRDFPRWLNVLELLGLFLGPFAYIWSRRVTLGKPMHHLSQTDQRDPS